MYLLHESIDNIWLQLSLHIFFVILKYFLFAGVAFLIFYVWKKRDWQRHKIQQKMPKKGSVRYEIFWSVVSRFIMALIIITMLRLSEYTLIYSDISIFGWGYFVFSVLVLILLHDSYFYWAHRLMHHPRLYKHMHKVHHHSINPTPWASFSFHPSEAVVEVAFFPIIIFLIPTHVFALFLVVLFQMFFNVYGHAGFELFPRWWVKNPITKFINTSVHHNLHHKEFNYNYGLYFNHWDRWMGTLDPEYDEKFLAVKERALKKAKEITPLKV